MTPKQEAAMRQAAMRQALEALEKEDRIAGYPNNKGAITALREALADSALDKLAETERNLGLDYTITQANVGIGKQAEEAYEAAKQRGWAGLKDEQPEQQEPVAKLLVGCDSDGRYVSLETNFHSDALPLGKYDLYTHPQACEPLTDEEIEVRIGYRLPKHGFNAIRQLIKEATHGIGEKK